MNPIQTESLFPEPQEKEARAVFHFLSNGVFTMSLKQHTLDTRDAKRIIHELHRAIYLVETRLLPELAKALANDYCIPQKVMLKAMRRFTRLHHSN